MKVYIPNVQAIYILLVVVLLAGCGDSSTAPGPSAADVQLSSIASHGDVLADSDGRVLYFFTQDAEGKSRCEGDCIVNWPVFYTEQLQVGSRLNPNDFGSITRPDGSSQTTYKGWPLYYYINDGQPGVVNGDGINNVWFVAKPDYSVMIATQQLVGHDGVNYRIDDSGNYVEGDEMTSHIVDVLGRTFYIFAFDSANTNNFTDEDFGNDGVWPIYHVDIEALPSSLDEGNFGEITVHGERSQLTYKGWPLYYFGQDEMQRGNTKGVSFPQPGIWPVTRKEMAPAPGYNTAE